MFGEDAIRVDCGRLAMADSAAMDQRVEWDAGGNGDFGMVSGVGAAWVLPPA